MCVRAYVRAHIYTHVAFATGCEMKCVHMEVAVSAGIQCV